MKKKMPKRGGSEENQRFRVPGKERMVRDAMTGEEKTCGNPRGERDECLELHQYAKLSNSIYRQAHSLNRLLASWKTGQK